MLFHDIRSRFLFLPYSEPNNVFYMETVWA